MASRARQQAAVLRPLSAAAFERLVAQLRRVIDQGKARVEETLGRELVRTYHELGGRIVASGVLEGAGYADGLFERIAQALGVHVRVLQHAVAFARAYPELPSGTGTLRWTHYRELLRLPNPTTRTWYEQQAVERGWSRAKLIEAMRREAFETRGKTNAKRDAAPAVQLPRPKEATYVYEAAVERVVDGDTLLLLIDLGFQVLKRQRVRLAGIDTPPRETAEGEQAYEHVRDALAPVPFVMVKTNKIDVHGRYVGHVFYAPGVADKSKVFARGRYLNQELVTAGLAQPL